MFWSASLLHHSHQEAGWREDGSSEWRHHLCWSFSLLHHYHQNTWCREIVPSGLRHHQNCLDLNKLERLSSPPFSPGREVERSWIFRMTSSPMLELLSSLPFSLGLGWRETRPSGLRHQQNWASWSTSLLHQHTGWREVDLQSGWRHHILLELLSSPTLSPRRVV